MAVIKTNILANAISNLKTSLEPLGFANHRLGNTDLAYPISDLFLRIAWLRSLCLLVNVRPVGLCTF
jgi:hypothetical protein